MANPKQDVNGLLADIERGQVIKRRALASPLFNARERRELVQHQDAVNAILTKKCVELGAPLEEAAARLPRRKNGHAKSA